jgi:uncharacterized protein (DUF885 family)
MNKANGPFGPQEPDGFGPALPASPRTSVVPASHLARARAVRALRDLERGRRRYRMAYQRLLRRERDPEKKREAHRELLGELRRLEAGFEAAMEAVFEAEAREAQEAVAVRARLEGWP